jgi:ADP-ribose pyrophosphatase
MERWNESKLLYDGRVVRLRIGEVTLDDGTQAFREVVEHPGGVCVVPFTGHSVILVKQFRIAIGDYVLEAPAGKLEGPEEPEARGRAELEEETGHRAGQMIPAGFIYASVGYCSEKIHLFLALDLVKTEQRLEDDERIELVEMPIEDIRRGLAANAFEDGKTVVGLYALLNHLEGALERA